MDSLQPLVALPLTANSVLLPIFAGIALLCNIVPFITLVRVKNLPASTLIATLFVVNTWAFINACIWPRDDFASWWNGHGLCDIEATLRTPLYTLLALCVCMMVRDLARAVDVDHPRLFENKQMRRRRIATDVLILFGLPILQLPLHYVVQYDRYSLIATYGCVDLLDNSWPRIVLLSMWPMTIGLINCYYSAISIIRLHKHRGRLSSTLSRSGSGLDSRKFLKLLSMTSVILIIYLPVICYFFYTNIPNPFVPYSWTRIHNPLTWNYIIYFHTADYPDVQYWGWVPIGLAFIMFIWYGITTEAINCYRQGLLFFGLGKIWPKLNEPYVRRKKGSSVSKVSWRNSWAGKLDILGKAVDHFDGNKNQGTKISQDTATTTASGEGNGRSSDPDVILPVSSSHGSATKEKCPKITVQELETPSPVVATPPQHRGMLSAFRTYVNLPFPLFSSTSKSASITQIPRHSTDDVDLEKQAHTIEFPQRAFIKDNSIETNIWSGSVDKDENDPAAPKMGTRAYRERERERHELAKRESKENDGVGRAITDNVYVDLQIHSSKGEHSGVAIRRELEQKSSFTNA